MICRNNGPLSRLSLESFRETHSLLREQGGQTLVEHSLLLGGSTAVSSVISIFQDHPLVVLAVLAILFISLLFWKPKVLAAVLLIAVLLLVFVFVYRLAEYGHI